MSRLSPWFLAALALAGCSKNTARPNAKMSAPQGVAIYHGYGSDLPGVLRPLVAVANTNGGDLRLIDAVSDKVLAAPTAVAALAVPTEPRPALIAAGSLHDQAGDGTPVARADLLVVASRGQVARPAPAPAGTFGAVLQSIVTWDDRTRVDVSVDLGDLLPDAALTSLLVVPVPEPDGAGGWRASPGQARVLAATSDGTLVSIQATRAAGGEAILLGAPVVQPLGFTALDLAGSPDGTRVYAATLDPIPGAGGVLGVAEFDNTATPGAMPVRALPARLGTTRVAALEVAPFVGNNPGTPELDAFGPPALRVYAALDQGACGPNTSMPCGLAVIDPVLGTLAADPAGELPFQRPIEIPGEVMGIAVSGPPLKSDKDGYLKFEPGAGLRWTRSFAAVSSSQGRIYLIDPSHFGVGNANTSLTGSAWTRIPAAAENLPSAESASIGLWSRSATVAPTLLVGSAATAGVAVTPGYTPDDTFFITYQGHLPGLLSRWAVARVGVGAPSWVAVQVATGLNGPGTSPWRSVARLYDPRAAVRTGDLVVVAGFPAGICPGGAFEMVVTALLPPDPLLYPGGALAVAPSPTQPAGADPGCLPQNADTPLTISVLAPGLVLTGTATGYAGRPEVVTSSPETAAPFELRYRDEASLPCPIMPDDPLAWPPAPGDVAACEADPAACRASCEQLLLARRARRIFYVTDTCPATSTPAGQACQDRWVTSFGLQLPLPKGPALSFKAGITDPSNKGLTVKRGATLYFTAASGLVASTRIPSAGVTGTGQTAAYGVALFDRSAATGVTGDAIHGYAAFLDNLVLDFAPWSAQSMTVTIR